MLKLAGLLSIKDKFKIFWPVNDIRSYGERGNGSSDDTPAFQKVLKAFQKAGGGSLYIPPGTFLINAPLVIDLSLNLYGAGSNSIIRITDSNCHVFTLKKGASDSRFYNFQIQGAATTENFFQCAFFTEAASIPTRVTISHLLISGPDPATSCNNGIKLDSGANDWKIMNNHFERLIGSSSGHGYGILLGAALRNIITGNHFAGSPGNGRHAVYLAAGASYNIVAHNIVQDYNESAFPIATYNHQPASQCNQIIHNTIINGGRLTHDSAAIEVYGKSSYNYIAGNLIMNHNSTGIIVTDGGRGGLNIGNEIVNNAIYNVAQSGITIMGAKQAGVRFNKVYNCSQSKPGAFSGIIVRSDGTYGKELCDGTQIIGNSSWGEKQRAALEINPSIPIPTNTVIAGNLLLAGATPGTAYLSNGVATTFMYNIP